MALGRMMDYPLTLTHLLNRARLYFPRTEVVSRRQDGSLHRQTWLDTYARAGKLANALTRLGVKSGDRVATLAWNHHKHLEAYFAVPMMGAIVHTLNLRLHASDLAYIARHAEDSVVLVDRSLLPLLNQFLADVPTIRHVIVMTDDGSVAGEHLDYEKLLAVESAEIAWPKLDENTACTICYTSGTTGKPKGVVYSHRSCVLHALLSCTPDAIPISQRDVVMPVVPMFHANAWGYAHMCAAMGAKLVFPGPKLDPESLLDLMVKEGVTCAGGVPTIWLGMLALLDANPKKWDLSRVREMVVGGAAAPPALIEGLEARHGIKVTHAWGMTETNPLGTVARVKSGLDGATAAERLSVRASQGGAVPFVETRHADDDGNVLAWDGERMGELEVRGPWVAASYVGDEGKDRWTPDGWFKTGDVVTIDREGYVRICDRSKDVIKSGGEWISSVALENALMSHPAVLEAAVFAGRHPKWDERPL
ncbi:MAG: long-chain fatty acid--CoA ligase, partial [Polyangiaceae bacterium]